MHIYEQILVWATESIHIYEQILARAADSINICEQVLARAAESMHIYEQLIYEHGLPFLLPHGDNLKCSYLPAIFTGMCPPIPLSGH